jgi:AcrR family transcriptional regulator
LSPPPTTPTPDFTQRQNEVLEVALRLLVEGGEPALTTAGLARAANCSKESLYKWFGDREGLLAAMIAFQAAKVRTLAPGRDAPGAAEFRRHLAVFAGDLLAVLSGEVSIALNRLAIGQASRDGSRLGKLVLDRGRRTIEARARMLLEVGREGGYIAYDDASEAYGALYGLIVQDLHVRLLLGDRVPSAGERVRAADRAIDQFFRLHGATGEAASMNPARGRAAIG